MLTPYGSKAAYDIGECPRGCTEQCTYVLVDISAYAQDTSAAAANPLVVQGTSCSLPTGQEISTHGTLTDMVSQISPSISLQF